jgi:hypothetical protein
MNRKIIQIAISNQRETKDRIYALCDDGSVWVMELIGSKIYMWHPLPGLPEQ